jgi:D-alanyl-D-alanine carboxypeptidase/D-alanyl-D-alanine-endopeptidase (penicillin-binding protein 4)
MIRLSIFFFLACFHVSLFSQEKALDRFLKNDSLAHASISFCVLDATDGKPLLEYNSEKSLAPASIMKLVTSAAAIDLLGPDYTFKTSIGYTGEIKNGRLTGDIVIKGGGDPSLGSGYFTDHYGDFISKWIEDIKRSGIKSIKGRVIADDSFFDYHPVPSKWLWEDAGNYYGAGTYGLSVYDNTYEIHFNTIAGIHPVITGMIPDINTFDFSNWLTAAGTTDKGYVFAAPYSTDGWLAGTIPVNDDDFILKASITDPPFLVAKIIDQKLKEAGIEISGDPTTTRFEKKPVAAPLKLISETDSPPLDEIIEILNHFSINLYAEHLTKEMGRVFRNSATTDSGIDVIKEYLSDAGINMGGVFIEDGSGLSPLNAINSKSIAMLLFQLKKNGKYFDEYFNSLPDAGKEGTLQYYFKDPVFKSRFRAKGGSMTRVRSMAGYVRTNSDRELIICLIVNHYSGSSRYIMSGIEELIKEIILYN